MRDGVGLSASDRRSVARPWRQDKLLLNGASVSAVAGCEGVCGAGERGWGTCGVCLSADSEGTGARYCASLMEARQATTEDKLLLRQDK